MFVKVYYIEDEPDLCELFCDLFSSSNIEISTFSDVEMAIATAQSNPPDVFFVDYRLPDTNGDLIAQRLDPQIPKYLVTGEMSIQTKYQFNKIIQKPYKQAEIAEILNGLLQKKSA